MVDRRRREAQADLESARSILATALALPRDEIDDGAALKLVGCTWYIEAQLASPAAAWLLGEPARVMLKWLDGSTDAQLNPAVRAFRDDVAVGRKEMGFTRLRDGIDPGRRLLLQLLGAAWWYATGRPIASGDRDSAPLAIFLEMMVNPATGLPSLTQTPAAISAACLTPRQMLRDALAPHRRRRKG